MWQKGPPVSETGIRPTEPNPVYLLEFGFEDRVRDRGELERSQNSLLVPPRHVTRSEELARQFGKPTALRDRKAQSMGVEVPPETQPLEFGRRSQS